MQCSYLNEKIFRKEAASIILTHTKLNDRFRSDITGFPFRDTRQRLLKKQPLRGEQD